MGRSITQLETPVAMVDLDLLQVNIHRLQEPLDRQGVANRPLCRLLNSSMYNSW